MLVIDDNKLKLLKMKETLLKVSPNNNEKILSEYAQIVLEIDKEMYDNITNEIKNTNYYELPLEEMLSVFNKFVDMYDSFNEFQCKYRDIYENYSNSKLSMSDISNIRIDVIKEKINAINGYLINEQNIKKDETTLETLNLDLISAEKRKDSVLEKFSSLENQLKSNLFNAEGRIYNDNGDTEYISITKEYTLNDIDLKVILDNPELLKELIDNTNNILISEQEKLRAAEICFNNMPTIDTKKMYNTSVIDVLKIEYKLVLLKIVDLIANEYTKYEELKDKRASLKTLIETRKTYLEKLGKKLFIDPFDYIKLNEQIEIIESLGNVETLISSIKVKIKTIIDKSEQSKSKVAELLKVINNRVPLINGMETSEEIVEEEHSNNIKDNKVISISELSTDFRIDIAKAKTDGVIERVYSMLTTIPVENDKKEVIPELVIEAAKSDKKDSITEPAIDDKKIEPPKVSLVAKSEDSVATEPLFEELEPFKQAELFDDRYDDGVFETTDDTTTDKETDAMPELFWETKEKPTEDNEKSIDKILSFDEQVDELLSKDKKVKKLVA